MKSTHFVVATILIAVTLMARLVLAQGPVAGDPVAGKKIFGSYCHICHSVYPGKNNIGPSLFGVVGRHVGREAGYHYSKADLGADVVFDRETLDRYITSPRGTIPGTAMTYIGIKNPKTRADVIAYLATVH
jgi:cytochrome c